MVGLILVLQQPLTTALTKTKADIAKKSSYCYLSRWFTRPTFWPLSTNLSGPEPLTQVAVLSSDNEQDVYTLLALQIRFEAKSKEIIDKI